MLEELVRCFIADAGETLRTCPHRDYARIFEHNFGEGKAKKRKHTVYGELF